MGGFASHGSGIVHYDLKWLYVFGIRAPFSLASAGFRTRKVRMDNDIRRILVIENNQEMRSLLIDFIKGEGYEADSVET